MLEILEIRPAVRTRTYRQDADDLGSFSLDDIKHFIRFYRIHDCSFSGSRVMNLNVMWA